MNGYAYDNSRTQFHMEHSSRIERHYAHAITKHPYFCDNITAFNLHTAQFRLRQIRDLLAWRESKGCTTAEMLARCELIEAEEAYLRGDNAQAVEELYDTIAVLLRTVDVIEGRQKLGKPETNS